MGQDKESPLKNLHAYLGLFLALPLCIWAITGAVFLVKPGYEQAYEQLQPRMRPLNESKRIPARDDWLEATLVRTVLGVHLLVKDVDGNELHLDPQSNKEMPLPQVDDVILLLNDAIAHDRQRYGEVNKVDLTWPIIQVETTNNVSLELNWQNLNLKQQGQDTHTLNRFYRMHYLQWTPNAQLNKVLAAVVLLLLLGLCVLGIGMLSRFAKEDKHG